MTRVYGSTCLPDAKRTWTDSNELTRFPRDPLMQHPRSQLRGELQTWRAVASPEPAPGPLADAGDRCVCSGAGLYHWTDTGQYHRRCHQNVRAILGAHGRPVFDGPVRSLYNSRGSHLWRSVRPVLYKNNGPRKNRCLKHEIAVVENSKCQI